MPTSRNLLDGTVVKQHLKIKNIMVDSIPESTWHTKGYHYLYTWRWSSHLGKQTAGTCDICKEPIFYETQNWVFRKVCNRCVRK